MLRCFILCSILFEVSCGCLGFSYPGKSVSFSLNYIFYITPTVNFESLPLIWLVTTTNFNTLSQFYERYIFSRGAELYKVQKVQFKFSSR